MNINTYKDKKNLSYKELGRRTGISYTNIYGICQANQCTPRMYVRLIKAIPNLEIEVVPDTRGRKRKKPNAKAHRGGIADHVVCHRCKGPLTKGLDSCYCALCHQEGRKEDRRKLQEAPAKAYANLATAIFIQTCQDYAFAYHRGKMDLAKALERTIRSDRFQMYNHEAFDLDWLIAKLKSSKPHKVTTPKEV